LRLPGSEQNSPGGIRLIKSWKGAYCLVFIGPMNFFFSSAVWKRP